MVLDCLIVRIALCAVRIKTQCLVCFLLYISVKHCTACVNSLCIAPINSTHPWTAQQLMPTAMYINRCFFSHTNVRCFITLIQMHELLMHQNNKNIGHSPIFSKPCVLVLTAL